MSTSNIKKLNIVSIATLVSASSLFAQSSDSTDAAVQAGAAIVGLIFALLGLAIGVVVIVGMWKIFVKAGQPGWASLIPIYNLYIMCQITAKPAWWMLLLLFCPGVNLVFAILLTVALANSFGKGTGYALGLIFLPFVFYPMLGFGDASYTKPQS